jgi:hypothetical protein
MRLLIAITLTLLSWTNLFGQESMKLKMIIDMGGTDTMLIQRFDKSQRLIFWKSFPQYGMSQILTYTYSPSQDSSLVSSYSKTPVLHLKIHHDIVS